MEFRKITLIVLVGFLVSCVQHYNEDTIDQVSDRPAIELKVTEAKGFDIFYQDSCTKLVTRSIKENTFFKDSLYLLHNASVQFPENIKVLPAKVSSLCCQSSTHLAFLDILDKLNLVQGLCGTEYINNSEIVDQLGDVHEICLGDAVQFEEILSLSPDLYTIYPFASEEVSKLDEQGIRTMMIAEYLEETPMARLEWIKLYGVLFGAEEAANNYFEAVKDEYHSLVQEPDTNKQFFLNLPYGDSWYTPSSNSLLVKLLQDAGLYYYYQNEKGTENTPHAQEEMWQTGTMANYWVIIAERPTDFTLNDLIAENEVYGTFHSVVNHQVIFCNTATSDYFVKGVVEPHIMLKDLLFATHKISDHQPKYFHLLN